MDDIRPVTHRQHEHQYGSQSQDDSVQQGFCTSLPILVLCVSDTKTLHSETDSLSAES